MTSSQGEPEFNRVRAELFEALGHPTRIRILQTLESEPIGFAELKKAVGIESSGHLSFHLGKLEGLLKMGQDGGYVLTDEGREALRVISVTRDEGQGSFKVNAPRTTSRNIAIVVLVVGMLLLASFAVYQQEQIGDLNRSITSQQIGSIIINGTRYSRLGIPLQSLNLPATIHFNGVIFNLTAPNLGGVFFTVTEGRALPNVTFHVQQGAGTPVAIRFVSVPNVQVKFADGQSENYSFVGMTRDLAGNLYINFQPTTNPWFTLHITPRAGVYWNSTANSLEFLVSMGT